MSVLANCQANSRNPEIIGREATRSRCIGPKQKRCWPMRQSWKPRRSSSGSANSIRGNIKKGSSAAGLVIQEILAAFSANFVRWAAVWLHEACPDAPAPFDSPQPSVKQMVRIAANTLAWVMWQPGGCLLKFTELSAFAGVQLAIQGSNPLQLALPLFKSRSFSPI